MSVTTSPRALVQSLFEAWAAGDRGPFARAIHPAATWTLVGTCPGGGTYPSTRAFMEASSQPFHDLLEASPLPVVEEIVADGNVVIVRWRGCAVTKLGETYENHYCWWLRVNQGRLHDIISFCDTLAIARVFEHARGQTPT